MQLFWEHNWFNPIATLPNLEVFAWTDSTVTLAWIKNPSRLKTFVANRVAKIQRAVPGEKWNHVLIDSNPSESASRGISLQKLKDHQLWWPGPEWLRMPASTGPGNDIVLPKESLTEANRSHQVDENYRQTIVSNDTYYNQIANSIQLFACQPANNTKTQLLSTQQQHSPRTTTLPKKRNKKRTKKKKRKKKQKKKKKKQKKKKKKKKKKNQLHWNLLKTIHQQTISPANLEVTKT